MTCPFCNPDKSRVFFHNSKLCYCLWDGFAVSPGHALVIPTRHMSSWFDATREEQLSLLDGIDHARNKIMNRYRPDGFNIGINIGAAAGQTVPHLHVHVIPRYEGDVPDPRGGVRYVIPSRANYLSDAGRASYQVPYHKIPLPGSEQYPLWHALRADLTGATSIDIAVAFLMSSGLARIEPHLCDILASGGSIRILTGDYMGVTEPAALYRLLDLKDDCQTDTRMTGNLDCRVFNTSDAIGFHPKAYIIGSRNGSFVAYLGSSNLTESGLCRGIEWNYRLTDGKEPTAIHVLRREFDRLFASRQVVPLSGDWIRSYEDRWKARNLSSRRSFVDRAARTMEPPPAPHSVQREALAALERTRSEGNRSGLVVLATGLGKTWLAAFDSKKERRVLFVAHREEILRQARDTFRRIRPDATLGFYAGGRHETDGDVIFASIQTLGRAEHLDRFAPDAFSYIVIDEFHHAAARTYRRMIKHFRPDFMLALTATPDRSDGADLLALCDENLVYECDVVEGIRRGLLSSFEYYGVHDDVDFTNIPWRSGRFDPTALEAAVVTERRAENAYRQWRRRKGHRTLGFCVSRKHADYMTDFFSQRGVRCMSVHSGEGAASRTESIERLVAGELDVVFSVDMFNEGVDVPEVDTLLMLRPTESRILWMQQFGRGLRRAPDIERVTVIDYVGNHRVFLAPAMILLARGDDRPREVARALELYGAGELSLPPGCSVNYDLESIDILRKLARPPNAVEAFDIWFDVFTETNAHRPSASEAWHAGYDPAGMRGRYGSWFAFVGAKGGLSDIERQVAEDYGEFLAQVETTAMTSRLLKMPCNPQFSCQSEGKPSA